MLHSDAGHWKFSGQGSEVSTADPLHASVLSPSFQLRHKAGANKKRRVTQVCDKSIVCARKAVKAAQREEMDCRAAEAKDSGGDSK